MSFNYDKIKKDHENSSQWASYSDLFMVLSFVFLILYVTASLRTGTHSIQQHLKSQQLNSEVEDLKGQIQVYNTLKEEHLAKSASEKEREVYQRLMDKLVLLRDQANLEKEELRKKALENEEKEMALNQYQQIIRNIINANILSKVKIKHRDDVIATKTQEIHQKIRDINQKNKLIQQQGKSLEETKKTIEQKERVIAQNEKILSQRQKEVLKLNKVVKDKTRQLQSNQAQIKLINSKLNSKLAELKKTSKRFKTRRRKLRAQIAQIRKSNQKKLKGLKRQNQLVAAQLKSTDEKLKSAGQQLKKINKALVEKAEEKARLSTELAEKTQDYQQQLTQTQEKYKQAMKENMEKVKSLQDQHQSKLKDYRENFQKELDRQKLSVKKRKELQAQFRNKVAKQTREMDQKIRDLRKEAEKAKGELESAQKANANTLANLKRTKREKESLGQNLKKLKEREQARQKILDQVKRNLAKGGLKANVDKKSGEVTISFGEEYFETGSFRLKDPMIGILKKFIPLYSKGLFENKKVADKINSVEIIGFASPTFRGKFVNPQSLDPKDRKAVSYNLDLSYNRAKSIFNHIFNTEKMKFKYQKKLLPLVKVTGRSFLSENAAQELGAKGLSQKEYCQKFDCKKAQRVIIKFNLKNE